ncbi:MAG: Ribonuclease 3 [Thermodesulfobacteriota bacterium]|nr:Ribonuclease 3 [Thermodesulfobacteriota bacterium]
MMDNEKPPTLGDLEQALGYVFQDPQLLVNAFTHRSYTNENPSFTCRDNERLEFLGDAVLQLCISDLLMRRFPDFTEGRLSKMRATLVNEQSLAALGKRFGLGNHLFLGKGEEASGGRGKTSLIADTFEAVMAAVYLDGGYGQASRLIADLFAELILTGEGGAAPFRDYKSALQELCQSRFHETPKYQLRNEYGPDHDKTFEVELAIVESVKETGTGKSRKEAEQQAARKVLEYFETPQTS